MIAWISRKTLFGYIHIYLVINSGTLFVPLDLWEYFALPLYFGTENILPALSNY